MGRCTDRRDMNKSVESGVKLQTNKQTNQYIQIGISIKFTSTYSLLETKLDVSFFFLKDNVLYSQMRDNSYIKSMHVRMTLIHSYYNIILKATLKTNFIAVYMFNSTF